MLLTLPMPAEKTGGTGVRAPGFQGSSVPAGAFIKVSYGLSDPGSQVPSKHAQTQPGPPYAGQAVLVVTAQGDSEPVCP